jgi:outer membrane protein assembly factor BamB
MIRELFILLMSASLLTGCSWFGGKDNSEPPAKLKSFEKRVELRKVWGRDSGDGTDGQFVKLVPALVDGRIYVADRDGTVWALELETGKLIWRSKTGLAISAATGVGGGLVLVGSSEGQLAALDAETGEQRWRVDVTSEVLSVPQIYEDTVIIQTVDGAISALSTQDGQRRWIYNRSVPVLTLRGTSTPFVGGGVVLAGFANGEMVALEVATGREVWQTAVAVPHGRTELQRIVDVDANPVVDQGLLYAASYQGRLVAVSLQDGHVLWNRDMSTYAGMAVDSSQVFVTDADSEVWAIDRRSGRSLWKQADLRRRSLTGPTVIDDYVAVGDFEGSLHLLLRSDGSIVGRERVDSEGIQAAPVVVSGDRLLVLGAGGELVLYKLNTL